MKDSAPRRGRDAGEPAYPPDTGCEVSPLCVNCCLLRCKHDDPYYYRRWKRAQALDNPVAALVAAGVPHDQVAIQMGINIRTVFRALARNNMQKRTYD